MSGRCCDVVHAITRKKITPSNSFRVFDLISRLDPDVSINVEIKKLPDKKRQINIPRINFIFEVPFFRSRILTINIFSNATPIMPRDIATGRNKRAYKLFLMNPFFTFLSPIILKKINQSVNTIKMDIINRSQ